MNDETLPTSADELPAPPRLPWLTTLSALAVLFVFGVLVAVVLENAGDLGQAPATAAEHELRDLRGREDDILNTYGFNPATKTWRIPIDHAMNILIEEGKAAGELRSFPAAPRSTTSPAH